MPLVSGAGRYVADHVPDAALDAVVVHPPAPCGRSGSRLGEAIGAGAYDPADRP